MGKKLGNLIKAARTDAGFTQEQLAKKVKGASQSDIGRFECGEAEPTTQMVKDIAKACGVTQKSLLDAMPKTSKTSTSKTSKTGKAKTTSGKAKTSSTSSKSSMSLTATEKRLVELYRAADTDTKKRALAILRGVDPDDTFGLDDVIASLIEGVLKK